MFTRITNAKERYPTKIPSKAETGSPLGVAAYVQNISDNVISLKLEGRVYAGQQLIKDLNFKSVSYENVEPGTCCPFNDGFNMPNHDVTLRLTTYYWKLKPKQKDDVMQYGDWVEDEVREYEIAVILPPPPPPEFIDISISFSEAEPISVERRYFRP